MSRKIVPSEIGTEGLRRAVVAAGSFRKLADGLGINHANIARWKRIPAEYCRDIERLYGVPRSALRPDIFDDGE